MANSTRPTVAELTASLRDLVHWERFAIHLPGIDTPGIEIIKRNNVHDVDSQKIALFSTWLKRCPRASWEDVVSALKLVQENTLAEEIRQKFQIPSCSATSTASKVNGVEALRNCITAVLARHFARLRAVTEYSISDLAAILFSAGIIADGIRKNPTYEKVSASFIAMLNFQETQQEVTDYCQKYFDAFYTVGGPLKLAADKIKEDITETVQKDLGITFTIPR